MSSVCQRKLDACVRWAMDMVPGIGCQVLDGNRMMQSMPVVSLIVFAILGQV